MSSTAGAAGKMFIFARHPRATVEGLILALAAHSAPAMGESASARAKKHRKRPAPTVERSALPVTLDESGTPIIVQGQRPARTADYPKERAERTRTIPRGSST